MPTNADVKDFQHDFDAIRADVSALTDTVGKLASEAVNAAVGKNPGKTRKRLRRAEDEMWEGTRELGDDVMGAAEHEISRHPMRSVLIALGVGIAVGLFAFR